MTPIPVSERFRPGAPELGAFGRPRGRIHNATPMNGMYDAALSTKQATTPTLDMSTPAIDGPRMRERLNCVELSAMPCSISSCATIDGTIDWNDGIESASVIPTTSESTMMIQG